MPWDENARRVVGAHTISLTLWTCSRNGPSPKLGLGLPSAVYSESEKPMPVTPLPSSCAPDTGRPCSGAHHPSHQSSPDLSLEHAMREMEWLCLVDDMRTSVDDLPRRNFYPLLRAVCRQPWLSLGQLPDHTCLSHMVLAFGSLETIRSLVQMTA